MIQFFRTLTPFLLSFLLSIGSSVSALTTLDGIAAARDGRFQEAHDIWTNVGDAVAHRNLGGIFLTGVLGTTDFEAAHSHFSIAADMGDAQAMLSLGYIYAEGLGQDPNPETAEDWFLAAAELGLPEGQFKWAETLLNRERPDAETVAAVNMLKSAADTGYAPALALIGDLARSGTYTPKNPDLAAVYYTAAADAGSMEASVKLADMHLFAELGAPDIQKAVRHYIAAADTGSSDAMFSLAYLFYQDFGADELLLQSAFTYARTAALAWDERAQFLLGRMYLEARVIPRDNTEAFFWLDLAASAGVMEAHHLRALAYAQLGEDEAKSVHARAVRWFDENHAVPHIHRLIDGNQHKFE